MLKEVIHLLGQSGRHLPRRLRPAQSHHYSELKPEEKGVLGFTLSPDTPVMSASSADLTIFLRKPPRSSLRFFPRMLS